MDNIDIYQVTIEHDDAEMPLRETWVLTGPAPGQPPVIHRSGGKPAVTEFDPQGNVIAETFYHMGQEHRWGGRRSSYRARPNGALEFERWTEAGKPHREGDLPAIINYGPSGEVVKEEYFLSGRRHRHQGPALIEFCAGRITQQEWYLDGVVVSENMIRDTPEP